LVVSAPPILSDSATTYTDPLPQALVLTAIVISFGMTAVVVMIALGAYLGGKDDRVNDPVSAPSETPQPEEGA
jgi:multicomponent K+:H+ antiporter subunit C